jgi:hypothetical protein
MVRPRPFAVLLPVDAKPKERVSIRQISELQFTSKLFGLVIENRKTGLFSKLKPVFYKLNAGKANYEEIILNFVATSYFLKPYGHIFKF